MKNYSLILLLLWLSTLGYTQDSTDVSLVQDVDSLSIENSASQAPLFVQPDYSDLRDSYSISQVPHPKRGGANGFITDPNDYISSSDEQQINALIWQIEQKTTAQIAVVMLPSIGTEVPKNFAVDLFEDWGIGQADTDNGLLLLTVMDQRRTEFEVGYGLEPILTDAVCYRIGTDEIVPRFKQGEFGQGIINAVDRVGQFLNDPDVIDEIYSTSINHQNNKRPFPIFLLIPLLAYLLITSVLSIWKYGIAYDIERSQDDFYDKYQRLNKHKPGCLLFLFPIPFIFFNRTLKQRLKKYRYAPRFSKVSGKALYLKDEWAENTFLEHAQILEEKIKSVRYDVWTTHDDQDILILEYEGSSRKYSDCKKCGYKTFGKDRTEILSNATYSSSGEKLEHYYCRNCHFKEEILVTIPKLVKSSSSSGSSFGSSSGGGSSSFGGGSSGGGGAGVSW